MISAWWLGIIIPVVFWIGTRVGQIQERYLLQEFLKEINKEDDK